MGMENFGMRRKEVTEKLGGSDAYAERDSLEGRNSYEPEHNKLDVHYSEQQRQEEIKIAKRVAAQLALLMSVSPGTNQEKIGAFIDTTNMRRHSPEEESRKYQSLYGEGKVEGSAVASVEDDEATAIPSPEETIPHIENPSSDFDMEQDIRDLEETVNKLDSSN